MNIDWTEGMTGRIERREGNGMNARRHEGQWKLKSIECNEFDWGWFSEAERKAHSIQLNFMEWNKLNESKSNGDMNWINCTEWHEGKLMKERARAASDFNSI